MSPEVERPDPPYMQVVKYLREQIHDGQLPQGSTIPSARQIAKDWGVSLATATKVLASLRSEGLVQGVVGVGTVVTAQNPSPQAHLVSIQQTGRIYPRGDHARILVAELTAAPEPVALALSLPQGADVIRRHRITLRGETPISLSTSWFDGSLAEPAPLLLTAERLPQGTPGYIKEMTGREAVRGRDDLTARTVTPAEAELLRLESGSVVLTGINTYTDRGGEVLEYGEYVSSGELVRSYTYEITA